MSDESPQNPEAVEPKARTVGGTEYSWCKAVPGGTGITVLALLLSKPPDIWTIQTAIHNLQNAHPILRSKLHFTTTTTKTFSFLTPPTPHLQIRPLDLSSTSHILHNQNDHHYSVTPFHLILEHELNQNRWHDPDHPSYADEDVLFASLYTLSKAQWTLTLRLHTSACDRTTAVSVLRELLGSLTGSGREGEDVGREFGYKEDVNLGIEDLIPAGKANKPFWARGVDMLGYSLNSLRLANLDFRDANSPRYSQVVRLQMTAVDTEKLVAECKSREIKLCGALAAAGLIAAYTSKNLPDQQREKYAVVTLVDCRSILDPVLCSQDLGFYHSAILNTHDVSGEDELWELANRCYMSFANAKNSNKHFSDMSDLNFLMCKAIENPSLTPSSSLRTALISVFEDPVIDDSNELHQQLGLEDFVGCASVHGVGPSIAIFDTIRNGGLDCACVYPSPLHSREQMQELIDHMRRILVDGCNKLESHS
ncbi:hypothetical protein I3760_10G010400 [Carya illinoinensis]|uniref:Uncharacterized protein n=1 Tax=Carya illinoinensis TaxID=32201 RepID=A0A8T1P8N6_CARIL|nr:uncharacterized protein LOC122279870 [Carya illinoinensis]KAG2682977.1 hypothetical protein I3760_10G010400 [Carya illinoinensis]KAG6638084.1 hypothetical protein CIPAW_10G010700 [Carya illinoinensis]KAG6690343.1 hypothetical protein I3842_10G010700 [Carya illinoinensis]